MIKSTIHHMADEINTVSIKSLEKITKNYKYISFDIFDTLLKRDVPTPVDAFILMQAVNHIDDFKNKRIKAEKIARSRSKSNEVTLEDIYACLDDKGNKPVEDLVSIEKQIELSICSPNKELLPFFKSCINEKTVLLISDMYLDRDVIISMLKKCGITGYDKLYISNELSKTKLDGGLYSFVLKDNSIKSSNLIHIGNSFKADYISAQKLGIKALKIATNNMRLTRDYTDLLCPKSFKKKLLKSFLNNHTCYDSKNWYKAFGYERFGPLLFGFINWLFHSMKINGIENVLFLARDGYIMRKVYQLMGYSNEIPDFYFEASRRSLRVPSYNRKMSYEDILNELTVPNQTNIIQIFDSLGLQANDYLAVIRECGFRLTEHIKRDALPDNMKFHKLYDLIRDDVMQNAEEESEQLRNYLTQFDFSKKVAIVDIGWGGSMQKYLTQTLTRLNIACDITGYYVGLTTKSKENLGNNHLKAFGYAFDVLNNADNCDMERPFVGLFETLFLEQDGSVKRYIKSWDRTIAERYPYEYLDSSKLMFEANAVNEIQNGALEFVKDYKDSFIAKFIGCGHDIMFSNLYQTGIEPTSEDVLKFGKFAFFNNGSKIYLANPQSRVFYARHPKELIKDIYDSQWKVGFLKGLLKANLPYLKIFNLLRKIGN